MNRNQISPLVQKRLKAMNLNADDVLRKALDIKAEGLVTAEAGVIPEGTIFLTVYKDKVYSARVKEGAVQVDTDGKSYPSVSAAAASITGRATTNGWDFWMVKPPNKNEYSPIISLRKK